MQLTLTAALLAAAAAMGRAAASPVEARRPLQATLYVCTDIGFTGNCGHFGITNAQCTVFPPEFENDISAIQPPTGWVCDAYIDYLCDGNGLGDITFPGFSDLTHTGYNDNLNSFVCYLT